MGVTGLWKLLESSGKPVPLETLENKVLAVDISIWLHQVVKGFQDNKGNALAQAHLLGLFHRLCKLLYYKIKPVFVFDGSTPILKRDTIAKRQQSRNQIINEADRLHALLMQSLAKEKIVQQALGPNAINLLSPQKNINLTNEKPEKDDIFKLPALPAIAEESNDINESYTATSSSDYESTSESSFDGNNLRYSYHNNIQSIDVKGSEFKNLPADVRHEILTDIKETRKQSSWGKLHELPAESIQFSSFQMKRLLKRRQVQVSLEEAEKEMGGKSLTLSELRTLLAEEGIVKVASESANQPVASDENTRFLLVRDLTKRIEKAEKEEKEEKEKLNKPSTSDISKIENVEIKSDSEILLEDDLEEDLQTALKMSLNESNDDVYNDNPECDGPVKLNSHQRKNLKNSALSLARNYMIEYGGMNDDDIKDLLQKTQIDDNDENLCQSLSFIYNQSIMENIPEEKTKEIKNSIIELPEESIKIISEDSDSDSDLQEVTETTETILDPIKKMEIHVNTESLKTYSQEDDIFADIFDDIKTSPKNCNESTNDISLEIKAKFENEIKQTIKIPKEQISQIEILENLKKEAAEICKINLEDIKIDSSVIEIKDSDDETNDCSTNSNDIIEIHDDEEKKLNKTPGKINHFFQTDFTIKRTPEKSSLEENVVKVSSPFFVNKTPSSSSKKRKVKLNETSDNEDEDIPNKRISKASKMLFTNDNIEKVDTVELAAKTLRENINVGELKNMAKDLNMEKQELEKEKNRQERMGTTITEKMSRECMELLRHFGIPYIIAPMEAEAQCAFLNKIQLTDGTITDDSDIWLFGGQTVYKNFFNQKKLVFEYQYDLIEKLFNIDREKLIQLAMLVGSDYTTGVNGIGSVTALEILATFKRTPVKENETTEVMSILSSLRKFRDWWKNGKTIGPGGKTALKSKLKNIELSEGFPNIAVVEAYLKPTIDEDREKFTWSLPDAETLREFAKMKFGWTRIKTDEILNPVMKKVEEKKSQKSIKNFFSIKSSLVKQDLKVSKRVKTAINKMAADYESEEDEQPKMKKIRSPNKKSGKRIEKNTENCGKLQNLKKPIRKRKKVESEQKSNEQSTSVICSKLGNEFGKEIKKTVRIPETKQVIPQKEKDLIEMEEKKVLAAEIFKKSKKKK